MDTDVLIIDGGECSFGIESTVLKLEVLEGGDGDLTTLFKLLIVRKGGISMQNLEQVIAEIGLSELVIIEQL